MCENQFVRYDYTKNMRVQSPNTLNKLVLLMGSLRHQANLRHDNKTMVCLFIKWSFFKPLNSEEHLECNIGLNLLKRH